MTTSTERVERHRQAQKASGQRLLTTWVSPATIKRLRELAKGGTIGAVIDKAFQATPGDTDART